MTEPTLVVWILYDATADKKYIKMDPVDGSLAIFDTEEAAIAAKKLHWGTDCKRCEYYSAPAEKSSTKCPGAGCTDQGCPAHYAVPQPTVQRVPAAWMNNSPDRVDVIHAAVKKLLIDSPDNAGHLHRPLDKSEHYTVPLYTAPQPAPDVAKVVESLEVAHRFIANGIELGYIQMPDSDTLDPAHETLPAIEAALAEYRAQGGDV